MVLDCEQGGLPDHCSSTSPAGQTVSTPRRFGSEPRYATFHGGRRPRHSLNSLTAGCDQVTGPSVGSLRRRPYA